VLLAAQGPILLCGTCRDARGLGGCEIMAGGRHSMEEQAAARVEADKVQVF